MLRLCTLYIASYTYTYVLCRNNSYHRTVASVWEEKELGHQHCYPCHTLWTVVSLCWKVRITMYVCFSYVLKLYIYSLFVIFATKGLKCEAQLKLEYYNCICYYVLHRNGQIAMYIANYLLLYLTTRAKTVIVHTSQCFIKYHFEIFSMRKPWC